MIVEKGTDVVSFWRAMACSRPDIISFAVSAFFKQQPLQARIPMNSGEQEALAAAEVLTGSLRVPFLDAVVLEATNRDLLTDRLLDEITKSNPPRFERRNLAQADVAAGMLREVVSEGILHAEVVVMLSEVVTVRGSRLHFPMLDMRCNPNDSGLRTARTIADRLLPGAYAIFHSGHSFHIVGTEAISDGLLQDFLHESLFYCPLVDRHYVAHHLRHRACSLRVSPDPKGSFPTLTHDVEFSVHGADLKGNAAF